MPQTVSQPGKAASSEARIDSWKEIATYLKRGVRTAQRWEREEGLPVHRLQHDKLGSVYAFASELDAWWESRQSHLESPPPGVPAAPAAKQTTARVAQSIAVLPFADLSQEKDQEYFCHGIADELISALNRVSGLQVASRTSSFRFKDSDEDIRDIGRQLQAASILEGTVRKSGNRLRVSVQLTGTENGFHLWAQTYDRELGDVFQVQEEIARSVARALEVTLSPGETAALHRTPTQDVEAYDYYLRGRKYYYRFGQTDMECAIQLFERAIEKDPAYAPAHAGLADCWSYLYLYSIRSGVIRDQAEKASRTAAHLDPDSGQAQASLGLALSLQRRDSEAVAAFERAIQLEPNLFEAHYFFARHCFVAGQAERAAVLYEAAMRLRPDDYQSRLLVAQTYDDLARVEDARRARLEGIALAEQHLAWNPDDVRAVYMAANGMAAMGERDRALEWVGRALAMRPDDSMLLYNAGCIYSLLGCTEEAMTALESAVRLGLRQKGWFEHDNNLNALRAEARFQRLLSGLET